MPLLWMREEAVEAGLKLHPPRVAFRYEDLKTPKINDSLTFGWWLLELLPVTRLRYNNSDEQTRVPHVGKGRVILPGQKIHASVLFRTNYRSKASFWRNLRQWPEAIYFHIANDQERLSKLADTWEVPFKRSTAEVLVGAIHKKHILDYVDRLAFMCSFELGIEAVRRVNAPDTLEALLGIDGKTTLDIKYAAEDDEGISPSPDSKEIIDIDMTREVHDPQTNSQERTVENKDMVTEGILGKLDIPDMLNKDHQDRACAALPTLCEIKTLRSKLLTDDVVNKIVNLCRTAGEIKLIAIRTLSCLAQRFDEAARILSRRPDFIKEILVVLKEKSAIVVVAALKIIAIVAKKVNISESLSGDTGIELVKRLKTLIKRRDFFVTPAAVAALCEICCYDQLRTEAIHCDVLITLVDLFKCDKQGLSGGPRGLIQLAEFDDVRKELAQGSHISRLVAFSRDKVVEKSSEATEELTKLSEHHELRSRIIDKGGVDSIVDNLAKSDHALFAADALLTLMNHDDAKERIMNTKVDLHLLQMIEGRIFDVTIHQEGIDILAKIFEHDTLRSMMLKPTNQPSFNNGCWNFGGKNTPQRLLKKATNYVLEKTIHRRRARDAHQGNIIGILRQMIGAPQLDVQKSAIKYLGIIAQYGWAMNDVGMIKPLLRCLQGTDVDIVALNNVLQNIARDENEPMLADMLSSPYPVGILRITATLKSLSSYGEIRKKVQGMREYQDLKDDPLHYLDPHHHPHEHDLYNSASDAIRSMIEAFDASGVRNVCDKVTVKPEIQLTEWNGFFEANNAQETPGRQQPALYNITYSSNLPAEQWSKTHQGWINGDTCMCAYILFQVLLYSSHTWEGEKWEINVNRDSHITVMVVIIVYNIGLTPMAPDPGKSERVQESVGIVDGSSHRHGGLRRAPPDTDFNA
ncbi:hypothetical protein BDR04DRAFT_1112672 [Suillus decipiens]|nr:hypothetical protein BDR04DRAFT_1112672 [Suillus decipiens]